MKRFILFVFVFYYGFTFSQINQYGLPFIKNYTIKDYNAYSQNWVTSENEQGIMYFGNNDGVLEYDGVNWKLIPINKGAIVKSLKIDSSGIIYVGADNEFGFIKPDKNGKLFYTSLSDSLTQENQNFSSIFNIYIIDKNVLFCANKKIFKYKDNKFEIINLPKGGFFTHRVIDDFYMGDYNEGLMKLNNNKFEACIGADFFAKKDIMAIFPYSKNEILCATSLTGLYIYNTKTGLSRKPETKAYQKLDTFISNNYLYNGIKQKNKYLFITIYGGTLITDEEFNILEKYNTKSGIQDEITLACYKKSPYLYSSPLWLSLNNGISKIESSSSIRIFNEKNGLENEVLAITEYEDNIYLATSNGVLYIDNSDTNTVPKFKHIENTEGQCWNFTSNNESLFVSSFSIFQVKNKMATEVTAENQVFKVLHSKVNQNVLYAGREKGFSVYSYKNETLHFVSDIKGINEKVDNIIEDTKGNLWLTTDNYELLKVSITEIDTIITKFKNNPVFSNNKHLFVFKYDNEVFFSIENDLLVYDAKTKTFISEKHFPTKTHNQLIRISKFKSDIEGNIWAVSIDKNTSELKFLKKNKSNFIKEHIDTRRLNGVIILDIYPDTKGIVWIATTEGLYTYNTNTKITFNKEYYTLIRQVVNNKDSIIFNGTYFSNEAIQFQQPETFKPTFEYKNNSLTFHFAAPFFIEEKEIEFQTFLIGFDDDWSKSTKIAFKEYTNLHEGTYTFKVKAKNIYGVESEVTEYSFKVNPPWYRAILAYFIYFILGIAIIWVIVKLNTRRLQKDKEILEGIVKERTAEIIQQKEEIQAQADNLQVANEEITTKNSVLEKQKNEIEEKTNHITASIEYASRIQHAILPPHELIKKHLPDNFILFKPRDIVSGDFYWLKQIGNNTVYAAADCTGHGVPGAFMSMLGISFLNEIVTKARFENAGEILNKLRDKVKSSLRQTGKDHESKDGMDIAICIINNESLTLEYSGAYNPLYILRKGEFIEIKATRNPIGIYLKEKPFESHKFQLENDDVLYIFSDGYVDQFGGEKDTKFKTKNFKKLLVEIYDKPMEEQKNILDSTILKWQGETEQTDDIIIFGVKI